MPCLALAGNAGGITVSTLRQAAYFLAHGIADLAYAVGMVPGKLDAAAALGDNGAELKILTDSPDVARAIAAVDLDQDLMGGAVGGDGAAAWRRTGRSFSTSRASSTMRHRCALPAC